MCDFIIRDVKTNDKNEVIKMMKDFYDMPAVLHKVPEENFKNTFNQAILNNPYLRLLVAEAQNNIAGYCLLAISYSNEAGGICIFIEELMTKEEYRNKGLGYKFLSFVENEYKDAKRFRLEVTKDNKTAIDLYKKFGFEYLDYKQMVKE